MSNSTSKCDFKYSQYNNKHKGNIIKSQLCTYPFTTIQANVIKSKSIIVESKKANKYLRLDNSHGNGANKNLKTRYGDKDTNSEKLVGMMFS